MVKQRMLEGVDVEGDLGVSMGRLALTGGKGTEKRERRRSVVRKTASLSPGREVKRERGMYPRYKKVCVLILTWSFHDLRTAPYTAPAAADYISLEDETRRLRDTLEGYGYDVEEWETKKQTFVAASTTEAEFANLLPAGQSAMWIYRLLEEYGARQEKPIILYTDSENARKRVLNPNHTATRRVRDIRYKWIIDRSEKGDITVIHISGQEMVADGLTKPLLPDKHAKFVKMMGLVSKKLPWNH